jgi:Flp pilus assembly protein TadB
MERGTEIKRTAGRIVTIGVGLLMIAGLVMMAKVFMKGFFAGAAVALIGVVCVMIWMRRSGRRRDE